MQLPLQITFRNMEPTEAIEAKIRERSERLDRVYDRIMSCRVVVESPHRHHHQGNLVHLRIDLKVPNGELVVNREPNQHHAHEDAYVAIRDAFDAMQRQLEDFIRRQRADVKLHEASPLGRVASLFPDEGYGFISTSDGREIYFHRNSVGDDGFAQLSVGSGVRFVEQMAEKGPQATTVRVND